MHHNVLMKLITLAFNLGALLVAVPALCQPLEPQLRACLTRNVLAFGASVTQATPSVVPGYGVLVKAVTAYNALSGLKSDANSPLSRYAAQGFGGSPARYLVKDWSGKSAALNNITYIGAYFTHGDLDTGSYQTYSMLVGDKKTLYYEASLIIGVDAFYWDAVYNNCEDAGNLGTPQFWISKLIAESRARSKTLILGTVPFENTADVKIKIDLAGGRGLWFAPVPSCAEKINRLIYGQCRPENNCYISDLHRIVADVQCNQKESMRDGRKFGLFELRPDGVHLSNVGAAFVAEQIENSVEALPPACPQP